jgi:hypothetical protein
MGEKLVKDVEVPIDWSDDSEDGAEYIQKWFEALEAISPTG